MNDLISRKAAIEYFMTNTNWHDEDGYEIHDAEDKRKLLESYFDGIPSARPDNKVNLCDSCKHTYPVCPSKAEDVIWGNGTGNDNICACSKYEPHAQPEITDVQAIEHLQDTGWMQNHDHEMYMMGKREGLADDSGSYDALIPAQRWIPVSEGLPEAEVEVFVYLFDQSSPYIAWISRKDGKWHTEDFTLEVDENPAAWMPLPEPYKEE